MIAAGENPVGTSVDLTTFAAELQAAQAEFIFRSIGQSNVTMFHNFPVMQDGEIFYMNLGSAILQINGSQSTLTFMHNMYER